MTVNMVEVHTFLCPVLSANLTVLVLFPHVNIGFG